VPVSVGRDVGGVDADRGSALTRAHRTNRGARGKIQTGTPPGSGTSIEVQIPIRQSFDKTARACAAVLAAHAGVARTAPRRH
jgi:hypothetical protein